eukprot:1153936-Pelagomonas_calceolata.AAC.9
MLLATNRREVYVPPPRAHLLGQPGQGDNRPASADMAHLGPPRPASADTPGVKSLTVARTPGASKFKAGLSCVRVAAGAGVALYSRV